MRDLELQCHEQLCCNKSVRWHGPGKHIHININRLRRDTEQHELLVKKVSWQCKEQLMPNRFACSVTSLVPLFSRLKRTAHRQKNPDLQLIIAICNFHPSVIVYYTRVITSICEQHRFLWKHAMAVRPTLPHPLHAPQTHTPLASRLGARPSV